MGMRTDPRGKSRPLTTATVPLLTACAFIILQTGKKVINQKAIIVINQNLTRSNLVEVARKRRRNGINILLNISSPHPNNILFSETVKALWFMYMQIRMKNSLYAKKVSLHSRTTGM